MIGDQATKKSDTHTHTGSSQVHERTRMWPFVLSLQPHLFLNTVHVFVLLECVFFTSGHNAGSVLLREPCVLA